MDGEGKLQELSVCIFNVFQTLPKPDAVVPSSEGKKMIFFSLYLGLLHALLSLGEIAALPRQRGVESQR